MGIYDFLKKGIAVKETKTTARKAENTERRLRTFNPSVDGYRQESSHKIDIYYPKTMTDAKKLADLMNEGEALLVDFGHAVSENEAQTMLDFLCGAAYVLGGDATQVRENTFLVTVGGVEIMVED